MKLGQLEFSTPIFLAPMAGVTDRAYRILAHEMGCPLVYSEMVSSNGIHYKNEHTLEMLEVDAGEHPMAVQLFGHDPERLYEAVAYVDSMGVADVIDFNMGCPAPKIVNNGDGSALLKNPELATELFVAMRKATKRPLTVKVRLGWDEEHITVFDIARRAEDAGLDAIAVHGRTRVQYYSGQANWQAIREVKERVSIPVIANGDVRREEDLTRILEVTGADGVMIGRAAQGDPWLFCRLKHFYETGEKLPPPTREERRQVIFRHLAMLLAFKGEYIGVREMRKHATWYTRGLPCSARLRERFNKAVCQEDFERILEDL